MLKAPDESSLQYRGWRVVAACFLMALFCWGFGFYGHGVYLAELQRLHGWSTSAISGASTTMNLFGAVLAALVSTVVDRIGPRRLVLLGVTALGTSTLLIAVVQAPWQLYVAYLVMAFGWMGLGLAPISIILGLWFTQRRGAAISFALNGASAGGILIAPTLVFLAGAFGFQATMFGATAVMLLVMLPVVLLFVDRPPVRPAPAGEGMAPVAWTRAMTLRNGAYWTITISFALGLIAQAGFLVHQINYLEPQIGRALAGTAVMVTTSMAVVGRLSVGTIIDRFDPRLATALSLLSQIVALAVMLYTTDPVALFAACALYGFSVGNIITFPALIIQREFTPAAFGMVVGLSSSVAMFIGATGPGLLGLARDLAGSYGAAIIVSIVANAAAAGLVMIRPRHKE